MAAKRKKRFPVDVETDRFLDLEKKVSLRQMLHLVEVATKPHEHTLSMLLFEEEWGRWNWEASYPPTAGAYLLQDTLRKLLQQRELIDLGLMKVHKARHTLALTAVGMRFALFLIQTLSEAGFDHYTFKEEDYEKMVEAKWPTAPMTPEQEAAIDKILRNWSADQAPPLQASALLQPQKTAKRKTGESPSSVPCRPLLTVATPPGAPPMS